MITYLFQGVQIGLGLAILVGPIIVLLIQLSLEEGTLSSFVAALGIWTSDLMYILAAHFGIGQLQAFIDHPSFEEIVGSIGGFVLLIVGIGMYLKKPPKFSTDIQKRKPRYWVAYVKGFAINAFNPFPIVFWSTISVGIVYESRLSATETLALYGAIMTTIMTTDSLKVLAARYLRRLLTPGHVRKIQRIGAVVLMLFGIILWGRVWL
ncbi:MAG: LysE family translocator [Bacteroidota bacterium]